MAFLSIHDLKEEESKGNIIIPGRLPFSAFSLDLRVNRLFRQDTMKVMASGIHHIKH